MAFPAKEGNAEQLPNGSANPPADAVLVSTTEMLPEDGKGIASKATDSLQMLTSGSMYGSGSVYGEDTPDFTNNLLKKQPGKHRTFYWVKTQEGHEEDTMAVDEVAERHGVPEHVVIRYIDEELEEETAVKSLPFALVLVVLYALMCLAHDTQASVRSVEEAINYDIEENANFAFSSPGNMGFKNMDDVNSYADFWSWMNKGMLPLYFQNYRWVSEDSNLPHVDLPFEDQVYYLNHNRKLGPMRLMQETALTVDCQNLDMSKAFELECSKDTQLDLTLDPTDFDVAQIQFVEETAMTHWLNMTNHMAITRQLEDNHWLNPQTYRIQVSFVTYNGNTDLLTMTNIHFMFSRSGHIWKMLTHRTFNLRPYQDWMVILWDCLFYIHITTVFVFELKEVVKELSNNKCHLMKFLKMYLNFWNAVDWVSIIVAYAMFVVWWVRYDKIKVLEKHVLGLPDDIECMKGNSVLCEETIYSQLYADLEDAGHWIKESNLLGAFYPVIIMLRLFKAFQAQPRLATVALTLYHSAGDLAHFGIVFLAAFFSFVFTAIALFGRELSEFAQFDRATMSLFRLLMGDFDYEAMQANDRAIAFSFMVLFQVTMFLIMLNMLVAIVMDVYSDTKHKLMSGETLWEECWQTLTRRYQNYLGRRVSFDHILDSFIQKHGVECRTSTKVMDRESFKTMVPGLGDEQAQHVLRDAAEDWFNKHHQTVTMAEVLSSASVASSCARLAAKRMRDGLSVAEMTQEEPQKQPEAPALQPEAAAPEAPPEPAPLMKPEELAQLPDLSLEEIFKAAELRLQKEHSNSPREVSQVAALSRILASLRLLSQTDPLAASGTPAGVRGHGVLL